LIVVGSSSQQTTEGHMDAEGSVAYGERWGERSIDRTL